MSKGVSSYGRKTQPTRQPKNVILIVCGGETERVYFQEFNIDLGKISVKPVREAVNPIGIVERAIAESNNAIYSQVWCVFDRDEFPDFDDAIRLGRENGIRVASSNQAFELWFLLHFKRRDGAMNRSQYARELSIALGRTYDKTDRKLYKDLRTKIGTAIDNAKLGHQCHKLTGNRPSQCESYTTVYILAEELLRWVSH